MSANADPLAEALALVDGAAVRGLALRLVGGLAVRLLCPQFSAREREGQDLDLAGLSRDRPALTAFLVERDYVPDRHFNAVYGHKQLYFQASDGSRALDVLVDRLEMCHVLDFRERLDRLPHTLDVCDLLLSKLQVVSMTEKDLQDALYLLAAFPVEEGDRPATVGLARFLALVADDWPWWRTVTLNLDRLIELPVEFRRLLPPGAALDPLAQANALRRAADQAPKSRRWRLRARVGERVRWYAEPEEVAYHH